MGGHSSVDPSMPLICGTPPWGLVSCAGSRDKQLGSMASTPAQELARLNDTNPPWGWTGLREMTIRIDWSWAMLVHICSIHLSVSFRPVRQLDKHTRQLSFLFGCFISSGPSTMVLSLSFLLFPPILCASRGKKSLSTAWSSLLHAETGGRACCIYPRPFPVSLSHRPRALPFDCSKDLSSMSIIVFCCFVFSCSVWEASFFVTGRHKIAFFFFFIWFARLLQLFVRRI